MGVTLREARKGEGFPRVAMLFVFFWGGWKRDAPGSCFRSFRSGRTPPPVESAAAGRGARFKHFPAAAGRAASAAQRQTGSNRVPTGSQVISASSVARTTRFAHLQCKPRSGGCPSDCGATARGDQAGGVRLVRVTGKSTWCGGN